MRMPRPPVTVTIPTYERNDLLRKALDSVAAQDYEGEVDAVVVDNSEDRGAEQVVDDYPFADYHWQMDHHPRHEKAMVNVAISRDLGLELAEGEYVHMLDDDDVLEPSAVSRKVDAVEDHPHAEGAYNAIVKFDGTVKNVPDVVVGNELAFVLTNLRPPTLPSATMVKRAVLEDCPPRRDLPHEDIAGVVEILLRTPLVYVDEPLTVRNDPPSFVDSPESELGRLRTHERYTGLRESLLGGKFKHIAEQRYESLLSSMEELEAGESEPPT